MQNLGEKYKSMLEKIIASKDPSSDNILDDSIAELQLINERMIEQRPHLRDTERAQQMRRMLNDIADEFRVAHRLKKKGEGEQKKKLLESSHFSKLFTGFIGGITLSGIVIAMLGYAGITDIAIGIDAQRRLKLDRQYLSNHDAIPTAESYLMKAVESVTNMQTLDPIKLESIAGKKFVSLRELDPVLAKAKPKQLGKYSAIIVQADRTGYKVLLNWPLCAAAKSLMPELIDPVRGAEGDQCSHFGYWNKAGERF